MSDKQRNWVIFGLLGIVLVLVLVIGFILGSMSEKNSAKQAALLAQPTKSLSNPVKVFLPLVVRDVMITPLPVQTKAAGGDIWILKKIDVGALKKNGFSYDVDTFVNKIDNNLSIKAQCAEPGWPTPKIGAEYKLNKWGVLIPVVDNSTNNLQRFIVLGD